MAGTHPTLYKILDNVIKLSECEVFSYTPDINSDPHAGDSDDDEAESDEDPAFSDDDDLAAYHSEPENDLTFTFDDDDELGSSPLSLRNPSKSRWIPDPPRKRTNSSDYSSFDSPVCPRTHRFSAHRRPRTPLLWSSHWFFYNKKLKRILFISVWARKKAWPISAGGLDEKSSYSLSETKESFHGWVGDVGAGARALGLSLAKSL
jgi:hypothetical protein